MDKLGWSIPKDVLLECLGATREIDLIWNHYKPSNYYAIMVQDLSGRQPVVMTHEEYLRHVPYEDRCFARWDEERELVLMVTVQYPHVAFHTQAGGPALYKTAQSSLGFWMKPPLSYIYGTLSSI